MKEVLDNFGKLLISHVRDRTISHYQQMAYGKRQGLHKQKIVSLTDENKKLIEDIVFQTVDEAIFNLLNMFEEYEENVELICKDKEGNKYDIEKISDGIMGELFTEDGWIAKFSKYEEKNS